MRLILTISAVASFALAATASAQSGKPRVAGIAPAPKPAPRPEHRDEGGYPARRHHRGGVQVIITADGRYYADVGYGWEPVSRVCSYQSGGAVRPGPGGTQTPDRQALPEYRAPTYTNPTYGPTTSGSASTQPAAAQPAATEGSLPAYQGAANPPSSTSTVPPTCWVTDSRGQTFIVTP